jgi:hypothetical protein
LVLFPHFVTFPIHASTQQSFPHSTSSYQHTVLHPPLIGPPAYCLPFTNSYLSTFPPPSYVLPSLFLNIFIPFTFSLCMPVHTNQNSPQKAPFCFFTFLLLPHLLLTHPDLYPDPPSPSIHSPYLYTDYSSALKMEAAESTTTSVQFHQTIRYYILNKVIITVLPR